MNTNQLPAVVNERSEYAVVDLTGACIHCLHAGTTCAVSHPTWGQTIALRKLALAA